MSLGNDTQHITLAMIVKQFKQNKAKPLSIEEQRRAVDKELRRLGKVKSSFRNKKQYKQLLALSRLQGNQK